MGIELDINSVLPKPEAHRPQLPAVFHEQHPFSIHVAGKS